MSVLAFTHAYILRVKIVECADVVLIKEASNVVVFFISLEIPFTICDKR